MLKNKVSKNLLVGLMMVVGLGSGVAIMASAQSVTTTPAPATKHEQTNSHAPLGGDGVVSSISGSNVVGTSISLGHKGEHADNAGDNDGDQASEANEPAGSGDTAE